MYGPNRAAEHPRASFRTAGGVIMKYRHPKLTGQISNAAQVDEVDVSSSVKLNDTFLNASPSQDSSFQETLVNGGIITITNHLLAGQLSLQVLSTTGFVGDGDFVACAHLIIASKDAEGGTFTVIESINGRRRITVFYGVSFKNVPHLIIAGNAVPTYAVVLGYAGWFQAEGGSEDATESTIWAVGNRYGLKAKYKPYEVQEGENSGNFYGGSPMSSAIGGVDASDIDRPDGDMDNVAVVPNPIPDGVDGSVAPTTVTW